MVMLTGMLMNIVGLAVIGFFIYLVARVRTRKAAIFHDGVDPAVAEQRYRRLKRTLQIAGIGVAVAIVGSVAHNILYAVTDEEEPISFFISAVGLLVFVLAAVYSFLLFFRGRRVAA